MMDFLNTALYEMQGAESRLRGALLTRFNEKDWEVRPYVHFVPVERMKDPEFVSNPTGFALDKDGVLLADTTSRSVFDSAVNKYIIDSSGARSSDPLGLIDVILFGYAHQCKIIQNWQDVLFGQEKEVIEISFETLRVSSSSFNIYTPFQTAQRVYRTLSLVDITTDGTIPFVMFVPESEVSAFKAKQFNGVDELEPLPDYAPGKFYRIMTELLPATACLGEAFVNYLAYSVAYYNLGVKVCDSLLSDSKYTQEEAVQEELAKRARKKPLHNVSITHSFTEPHLKTLLNCMGNRQHLEQLFREHPEVGITYDWVRNIYNSAPEGASFSSDEMYQACIRWKYSCRTYLLRFGLELLSQRLYVCKVDIVDSSLPLLLQGGGVLGNSIKRITW